jgi:group I intron endonuclease
MYGIVYKTVNTINDKVYIGQTTKTLGERRNKHFSVSVSKQSRFYNALKKYTRNDFDWFVLAYARTKRELDDLEVMYIAEANSMDRTVGYNLRDGGQGGRLYSSSRKCCRHKQNNAGGYKWKFVAGEPNG